MWIQTGVTVRKRLSWVVTSVTLTFDLWPWPFAWTSLLSLVITPENFMMIGWREHSQKGVTDRRTDGRTDGRTDWTIHRAAWSQLKISTDFHFIAECFDMRGQWQIIISMAFHRKNRNHIILSVIEIYITIAGNVARISLHWRHNDRDGVSNHRRLDCLLNGLFRRRAKNTSKLRLTRHCDRWIPLTKGHLMTSSLFQVKACRLIDIKPIPAPIKSNFDLKCRHFLWMHLKISSAK